MNTQSPLRCYVSIPYGKKQSKSGELIDFNRVYWDFISPVVQGLGLLCTRGDDSDLGANVQKSLIQHAIQSDLMIADITTANPNVIYDIGIRFATHPTRTILLNAGDDPAPFVLASVPSVRYIFTEGFPDILVEQDRLASALRRALDSPIVTSPIFDFFPRLTVQLPRDPCVFIGHGRSPLWRGLREYIESELKTPTLCYESESQVGRNIVSILETMLAKASFAVLLMTAEDLTGENTLRARQNVVHEAGLFQGHLGFTRAIVIRQESVEEYSNIAGLQYISFSGDAIEQTFPELRRVLHREGMLPPGVS